MKKLLSIILASVMLISLVACGGGAPADDKYVGKWISISGTAFGMTLTGDDIAGFGFDLQAGGKGTMTIDGDSTKIKWTNDDTNLTVTVEGEDLVGEIGEDTLTFINLLDLGMDIKFAKEGTDAAKPENALPENEKAMIGDWTSYKVVDVLGDDASGKIAPDALKMSFKADHTVDITYVGTDIPAQPWSMLGAMGFLTDENTDFSWETVGEEIEVTYIGGDDYWVFTCKK